MKFPQTWAELICKNSEIIAKYGCCAFVALWCAGIEPDDNATAIKYVSDAIDNNCMADNECTVKWADFFEFFTGRKVKVEFRKIYSLDELAKEPGRIPVRFDYHGLSHWVGVENGKIAFNSLSYSKCVELGEPTTARILTYGENNRL